jgi:cytochrome c oxidase cbb3-type subunit I/II
MLDPRTMSPGSIMPAYEWLITQKLDTTTTRSKINAMRKLGVPYPHGYENQANRDLNTQSLAIAASLQKDNIKVPDDREIIALIAYIQRLGTDIKADKTASGN